jgi:hypothetical protein
MAWDIARACYALRTLEGRAALGLSLGKADLRLLRSLERLFGRGRQAPEGLERAMAGGRARAYRHAARLVASLSDGSGPPQVVILRDLSGEGAFVEAVDLLPPGTQLTLHLRDPAGSCELHFPAEVVRRTERGMGLHLVGIPVECRGPGAFTHAIAD